jgi:hypothetical protein
MIDFKRIQSSGAVVGRPSLKGGVFSEVRKPDGRVVSILNRDVYDQALASAKATLRRNAAPGR